MICHAVQHGAAKGIIHRDIKPSNILVTLHDDMPGPESSSSETHQGDQPRADQQDDSHGRRGMIGTPLYMSPEPDGLDIDTRSNMLYELLTGRHRLTKKLKDADLDEVRRLIREQPPRPQHPHQHHGNGCHHRVRASQGIRWS